MYVCVYVEVPGPIVFADAGDHGLLLGGSAGKPIHQLVVHFESINLTTQNRISIGQRCIYALMYACMCICMDLGRYVCMHACMNVCMIE